MCDPVSLGVASLAFTAFGAISDAKAQRADGKAKLAEANYSAAIDRNNQIRAGYLADDAIARGKIAESQERLRGRLLLGQMRSVLAANGQIVDEGSAGGLVIDQAQTNELDAQTVRNNAAREAQDFSIRADQFGNQANLTRLSGQNANASARRASTSTLLAGAGKVANSWYGFKKAGTFS